MISQFASQDMYRPSIVNFGVGLTIFIFGLFKKLVLADHAAPLAISSFGLVDSGGTLTFVEAWLGALAYTFQLYFDFSGYSDMAIGISRMFGVQIPINFASPYKALNIIGFWRSWHMTLSAFLRDYLYIPLGGNRRGRIRRHLNLFLTMLLGGLWHGAGWTFIVWGALHGLYLVINHTWRHLRSRAILTSPHVAWRIFSWLLTFVAVVFAWVYFRASNLSVANSIVASLVIPSDFSIRAAITDRPKSSLLLIGSLAAIAFYLPNTQQVLARYHPGLDSPEAMGRAYEWQPSWQWACFVGGMGAILTTVVLFSSSTVREFLYYQF